MTTPINYAVVDFKGMILRTGSCPNDVLGLQAGDGESVIEHDGSIKDETHYYKNGEFTLYPEKPSAAHIFNFDVEMWIDPRSEEEIQNQINQDKVKGIWQINDMAGRIRSKYITNANGQQMVYLSKEAEAKAWFAAGEPEDLTEFPWLQAEVGITAPTVYELAQLWLNLSAIWVQIGSQLETIRLTAIDQIEAQTNENGVQAVVSRALVQMQGLVPT